ncbi:MAG: aminoacyl-histidine dipeptidase [Desulfatitalea sp.]|nr:aminoacyl-histidine dipeptidase [Desulfatitalea sp.]
MNQGDHQLATILDYFEQINAIPRCSKDEARLGQWLHDWAAERQLERRRDAAGNLVVKVPASPGMADRPTVIIQGHMDMVCEKTPDSMHDFSRDPIRSKRDGDWLMADRTTLGADNGIALAYALALAEDPTIQRPPLELLFTVDEETGLNGVKEMPADLISGKMLINLDSEDEGVFTIGCAGGMETLCSMPLNKEPFPAGWELHQVLVGGLRGGHSGIDIDKQRGNANKILARTLMHLHREMKLKIVTMAGGTRHNAIARDAMTVVACPPGEGIRVRERVARLEAILKGEYAGLDDGLCIKATTSDLDTEVVWSEETSLRVLNLLLALPHGVAGMSKTIEGLVESSSNLATMAVEQEVLRILMSQRSASSAKLVALSETVHAIAGLANCQFVDENKYPPWQPDMNAPLLQTAQAVYAGLFGKEPVLEVIHAGLECAIIGERCPGMQMISFGPDIENPHSPTERMRISSVGKVWCFLVALLEAIGR